MREAPRTLCDKGREFSLSEREKMRNMEREMEWADNVTL